MLSKFFAAAALGSALIAAPAFAQTSSSTTSSATHEESASASGLWQGSKLIGLNVYNDKNEKIGSIVQLMVDKEGTIKSVVIGVGGFLGMGERDVAVKFSELKWSNEPVSSTSSSSSAPPASSRPATSRPSNTTGSASTGSRSGPATYPDHAVFNATKDQLKAMPQFDYNK
ncbi:MAG TPA: PRC-barrel domain-containing protein [Xanthobacteraceae bacterium]|nr:PRC-barrel domain-containing protein [Xanthobacteraceae bacterium]